MKNFAIGIEGEVSSGKTSICKELVEMLDNTVFIDGGAIYRGIVTAVKKNKLKLIPIFILSKIKKVFTKKGFDAYELMKKLKVEFKIENKKTAVYIDGCKLKDEEIQTLENDVGVSTMAGKLNNQNIYEFARKIVNDNREKYNLILSARDLINIYPEMTCYVYVTCDIDERVNRRYNQFNKKFSKKELKEYILKRDEMHSNLFVIDGFKSRIDIDVTNCKSAKESAKLLIKKLEKNNYIKSSDLIKE